MRDQFPFLGIPAPARRQAVQDVLREVADLLTDPLSVAELLFQQEHREYHYVACDLLSRPRVLRTLRLDALPRIVALITTHSWWDTVDILAPTTLGTLLRTEPQALRTHTSAWIESNNIWLQRTAIIVQLKYKTATDADLLFDLILRRSDSTEFFVRKGAGWALREYAKVQPEDVRRFVEAHRSRLSNLTVREALKHQR